jgi:RNA polymerase sigma-70 factor (ECF subfamily)
MLGGFWTSVPVLEQDKRRGGNYTNRKMRNRTVSEWPDGSAVTADLDVSAALRDHARWLRAVVYSRVGDQDAVDDVMQEVALAAVRQAASLPIAERLGPWLYRVAVRQALLYRRKCGRRRKLAKNYVALRAPTEADERSPEPLQWLLAEERSSLLRAALERLPRRDKEILLLKYAENWNYREIAEHLGTTHSAVEARLHRARQRLRGELASVGESDDKVR